MPESLSPFVFDASAENFDRLILGNSARGLVLAHFWSPRAGPCMLLMPRLLKLASEFTGRFLLVMVNTDELGRQARDLGVTSVPTVKFFLHGKVAHTIHGAESEEVFRTALRRFLADPREEPRLAALALHQAGDSEAAIAMLARLAVEHPQDLAVATDLAKLLTLAGRPDEALALLAALPAAARADAGVAPLLAHLELIDAARDDAAASTLAEREPAYRLNQAARALFDDDPESAMESLLDLAAQAPTYRDDIGRRALLALFGMLGPEHALTRRFRARLAALGS
ncbi:MAG: tetratricopeptide repeat protein [Betaproteobacteria bacterium]|nr:tetratricopeptide repeat protein [Betaproteobacteria bacterium]